MKRSAAVLLVLASCAAAGTPSEEAYRCYLQSGRTPDREEALRLMTRAIALRPSAEYYAHRARIRLQLRQFDDAIADYTAAIALDKGDPALYSGRGSLWVRSRRPAEAEADFSEALRIEPGDVDTRLRRAELRRAQGRAAEAAKDVELAREKAVADSSDGYYNEGVRALNETDPLEAERMFRFALDLNPDHVRSHVAMARLYMERRRFAEAAAEFDQAIPARLRDAELYYHRGNARLAAGRGDDALADYEMAVSLTPTEPLFLAARGLGWHQVRKDPAKAKADFDEAIRLDPSCFSAWFGRGLLRHEQKDLEGAETDLRKAGTIRASPEGCLALGRVLHDRGDYDKALAVYRGALEIYKDAELQKTLKAESERSRLAKEKK